MQSNKSNPNEQTELSQVKRHHRRLYQTRQWAFLRSLVKARDDWSCVKCGSRYRVEVNHIISPLDGGEFFEISNCQTLCRTCHKHYTRQQYLARPKHLRKHRGQSKPKDPKRQEWIDFVNELRG